MKWEEVKQKIEKENLLLIEFNDIDDKKYESVKNIEDFIKLSALNNNIIGYNTKKFTSEEATELNVESIYRTLSSSFANWLEEMHDGEIRKLAKLPECEMIVLLNIQNNIIWEQTSAMSEDKFDKVMSIVEKYKEKYIKELTEEINSLIDSFKTKYKEAKLVKDKDAIVKRLSAELLSKYNLDGRAAPQYRKEALKDRLEN